MATFKVSPNTQANVNGTVHAAGDTFEAETADVFDLVAAGVVAEVEPKPKRKP